MTTHESERDAADPRRLAVLGFAAFTLLRVGRKVLTGTSVEVKEIAAGIAAAVALARAITAHAARTRRQED